MTETVDVTVMKNEIERLKKEFNDLNKFVNILVKDINQLSTQHVNTTYRLNQLKQTVLTHIQQDKRPL